MELWSKGLGRRVLSMSLGERDGAGREGGNLHITGIMHAPVYWDYRVALEESDVVDFLTMLQKPESVRFLATSDKKGRILGTAAVSVLVFFGRTVRRLVGGRPVESLGVQPPRGQAEEIPDHIADNEEADAHVGT
ncbi:MAG: hypothetical protein DYH08_05610 [Actinobacteria bacterium ATB1]|nr:hypothetical protein [Actinobacteria bacterium ATB1]